MNSWCDGSRAGRRIDHPLSVMLVNLLAEEYHVRSAPSALLTLGAVAKRHCEHPLTLSYFDRQIENVEALTERIACEQPSVVGLSAQFGALGDLDRVISRLETFVPRPVVVVGNVTATYAAEDILAAYPWVACCIGRGEETWLQLLNNVGRGGSWLEPREVPNLAFSDSCGRVRRTVAKGVPSELISPADWDGYFDTYSHREYSEVWVEASRGCPQKRGGVGCVYCAILPDAGSRDWAPRPLDVVMEDLSRLARRGVRHLRFADEEFMAHRPAHAIEFAAAMGELASRLSVSGISMPSFDVAMRVDDVIRSQIGQDRVRTMEVAGERRGISPNELRREALTSLRDLGLKQVYLGVESGSTAQLKRMKKAVTPLGNEMAIAVLRGLGIQAACGWIMFDPFLSGAEDLLENCAFIERNRLLPKTLADDFVTNPINRMRVLAGTPLLESMSDAELLEQRSQNGVEFSFRYLDPAVERLVGILDEWSSAFDRASLYELKNTVAHAGLEGAAESTYADGFFRLKALDFELCRSLVIQLDRTATESVPTLRVPSGFVRRREELRLQLAS